MAHRPPQLLWLLAAPVLLSACAGLQEEARNAQGEPVFASLQAPHARPLYESSAEDKAHPPQLRNSLSLFRPAPNTPKASYSQLLALAGQAEPYRLGVGDVLRVSISGLEGLPSLEQTQAIDGQGVIDLGAAGAYLLQGLNLEQAQQVLIRALSNPDSPSENDLSVNLSISQYHSQSVRLLGEIYAPGDYTIDAAPMSLAEAITRAGGLLRQADLSQIQLLRQGQEQAIRLDLRQLYQVGLAPERIMLRAGDVLSFMPQN